MVQSPTSKVQGQRFRSRWDSGIWNWEAFIFCVLLSGFCLRAVSEETQRFVLVIQFPYDQKVKLPFYRTGAVEKIDGEATVVRKGSTRVKAKLADAPEPSTIRPEYRAYVLWAVGSKGNFVNLGTLGTSEASLGIPLQAFGLVVSLESDPQAREPKGLFVLESHLPERKTRFFGMQKVFYTAATREDSPQRR